jgi:hydrogenase expression/formation protein HypE
MDTVLLAHGSGGEASQLFLESVVFKALGQALQPSDDSAVLPINQNTLAFTTDSYVVEPLFFPGGNIGDLAICGTVNDLTATGYEAKYLSLGLILEEGLPIKDLHDILSTIKRIALEEQLCICCGDTKVVPKGAADKIFINTSGIGIPASGFSLDFKNIVPDSEIILTGAAGSHGIAVMSAREGFQIEPQPKSDTRSLKDLLNILAPQAQDILYMKDPTRGGVATVLNEIACHTGAEIELQEDSIPVHTPHKAVSELLGLEILHCACEGQMLIFCAPGKANQVLRALHQNSKYKEAAIIGHTTEQSRPLVTVTTSLGGKRLIGSLTGELLPRIC